MKKRFVTKTIERLGKKAKSKRGSTLVELIATVAILSIVATLSLQAMFMAAEEYRRAKNISEAQRSISLLQKNLNSYVRNATQIEFLEAAPGDTVEQTIANFINSRNAPSSTKPLKDHETVDTDKYNSYFLCRSGTFSYTLYRYSKYDANYKAIFTVENIKEINFFFKSLESTRDAGANLQYMLDYTITSPTNKEIIEKAVVSEDIANGDYSISSGVILNRMYGSFSSGGTVKMRMSEGYLPGGTTDNSKSNVLFIETVPKIANE